MFFRLFLVFALFFASLSGYAKPKAYFDMDDSFWDPAPRFVIDGKDYKMGFWGFSDLPEAFASDEKARKLAEDYELYRNWAHGTIWGGFGLALTYMAVTDDVDWGVYWGIFLAGFLASIYSSSRAQRSLVRATNQYNGVYDSSDEKSASYEFRPSTRGLGLAIHF